MRASPALRRPAGLVQLGIVVGLLSAIGFVTGFAVGASERKPGPPPPPPTVAQPASVPADLTEAMGELRRRGLLFPLDGVRTALADTFEASRGGGRRHRALDIIATRHTPVRAVDDGTVLRLTRSRAGGISLYQVDREGRFGYYYAHLERYAPGLREGQPVARGEVLAYVGSSGNAAGRTPHLHFAIHRLNHPGREWSGDPLNPYVVLRAD